MARRKDPLLTQALLQSTVKYGAEGSALRELLREAQANLKSGLQFEKGAARGIMAATDAARPEIERAYAQGAGERGQARQQLSRDLGNLSAAADPFKAVSAREFAGSQRRMGEALAGALRELSERKVSAREGQVFSQRNLRSQYRGDVDKIRLRQAELAKEKGAFEASEYSDLVAAQREANRKARDSASLRRSRRSQTRLSEERNEIARQREQRMREEARQRAQGGPGGLSPSERRQRRQNRQTFKAEVAEARQWVNELKGSGYDWKMIRSLLVRGGEVEDSSGKAINISKIRVQAVDRAIKQARRKRGGMNSIQGISG